MTDPTASPTSEDSAQQSEIQVDQPVTIEKEDMLGPFFMLDAPERPTTYPVGTSTQIQRELEAVSLEFGIQSGLAKLEQLAEILGFKSNNQVSLTVIATDKSNQPLPQGTKIHLWHANADGGATGVPGGMYDNGPNPAITTLKTVLDRSRRPATAALIERYKFGRCYQTPDAQSNQVKFEAPVPAHYDIGPSPRTGRPRTRAMHYHLSIVLPDGYRFAQSSDVDGNNYFQTQLYFKDDPHAAEDQAEFGPNAGWAASRVIPEDGVIKLEVELA